MSDADIRTAAGKARDYEEQVFETGAGIAIKPLYEPADTGNFDVGRDLGVPGQYPFTRGPYPGMYRERIWTRTRRIHP